MKVVLAALVVLAACGGTAPMRESPLVKEGSDTPETCCCKSFPLTSEDGKPLYEMTPRMECSAKQGECVSDVQCQLVDPGGTRPVGTGSAGSTGSGS
jgi:hypothetical protein